MSKYYLFQDQKKCIGCQGCEVHCKTFNDVPVGPRLCQVVTTPHRLVGGVPTTSFIFMPCFHCEEPWCVSVCPTGAMQKRADDGIVFVDPQKCVGCKGCITACPWGAVQWNPKTGKAAKCNYCMDRLDRGLKPACVTKCTAHCLHFGKAEEMENVRRERFARSLDAGAR